MKTDTAIIDFSLDEARKFAWDHALKMTPMSPQEMQAAIHDLDIEAAAFGHMVVSPAWLIKIQLMPIRLFESSNVGRVLDVLAASKAAAVAADRGCAQSAAARPLRFEILNLKLKI